LGTKWLVAFFPLTFLVTWTLWYAADAGPGGLMQGGGLRPGLPTLLFYLGVFAPAFVAVALTAVERGLAGVRALLVRLFKWHVDARLYFFAVFYLVAIKAIAAPIVRILTGAWPTLSPEWLAIGLFATVFSTVIGGQAGEEVGWRGYALPGLGERVGFGPASIFLGIIWAVWHLPLFFIPGTDTAGQSFPLYVAQVTALSVAIAWLYLRTNGSLLMTMLMHSAINNTSPIIPSTPRLPENPLLPSAPLSGWVTAALLWIPAAYLLVRMRGLALSSKA
jgi:membrane protease YdiL (CAAX protease family)